MPQLRHSGDHVRPGADTPQRHDSFVLLVEPPPWMGEALCAQTDPESFFPEKGGSTREAKKTCASCTVQAECLDYALDNDERFGIWGGLSERERRRLGQRMSRTKTCRFIDCDEPTWSASARHCFTHRPFQPAIHETQQETA